MRREKKFSNESRRRGRLNDTEGCLVFELCFDKLFGVDMGKISLEAWYFHLPDLDFHIGSVPNYRTPTNCDRSVE